MAVGACVPTIVIVCLALTCVYAQVGSLCRPHERFLPCGCPKTCKDPAPNCDAVCKTGCFCAEGEVRNDTGHCVKLADCPPVAPLTHLETSEPRFQGGECPENEEYRFCEPCVHTCDNPNPICPAQCARGCFCKVNLLRDNDGRCVPFHECSNVLNYVKKKEKNHIVEPIPYRFSCGQNQVYKECEKCTRSCSDAKPVCGNKCKRGCFCKDGLVKGPDGKCKRIEECPTAATSVSGPSASSVEVEDCTSDEEYFSCGWCEPSCHEPHPSCPAGCTRGCLCRPPLLRHASGKCVTEDQCDTTRCLSNEEYVCRSGCEATCSGPRLFNDILDIEIPCDVSRPNLRRCRLGCYCKLGLLRGKNRRCVTLEMCPAESATISGGLLPQTTVDHNHKVKEGQAPTVFV